MGIARIGSVMQIAFVPPDFDAALDHWTQVMGVGPFFLLENMILPGTLYRGVPSEARYTVALSYWGDVQVELIRADDDHPSIYRDYPNGGGLHHVCVLTEDIERARSLCAEAGATVLVEAPIGETGYVLYVDAGGYPGGIVEIVKPGERTLALFESIRTAARNWNGEDPVRRLG